MLVSMGPRQYFSCVLMVNWMCISCIFIYLFIWVFHVAFNTVQGHITTQSGSFVGKEKRGQGFVL